MENCSERKQQSFKNGNAKYRNNIIGITKHFENGLMIYEFSKLKSSTLYQNEEVSKMHIVFKKVLQSSKRHCFC